MTKLKATNADGRTGAFTQKQWDAMGKDKAGWSLDSVDPPEEVVEDLKEKQLKREYKKHDKTKS